VIGRRMGGPTLALLIVAWVATSSREVPPAMAEPCTCNASRGTPSLTGTRVRVTLLEPDSDVDSARSADSRTLEGMLLPADAATAAVPPLHGERLTIDRSVIAEFESARRVPRAGRTTMIGATAGVLLGTLYGKREGPPYLGFDWGSSDDTFAFAFAGGVLGAVIGLLFGIGQEDERWTAAPIPSAADSLTLLVPPKKVAP